ncbi:hypothetical protein SEVCU118_2019 [Staphylococcus epidermidis VCU118]|nr:hypothetical protein SEVCU118_2019 [Staphylococcus epidermidis VCU118]
MFKSAKGVTLREVVKNIQRSLMLIYSFTPNNQVAHTKVLW